MAEKKWQKEIKDGYILVRNEGGKDIAYSPESGVKLLEEDGYLFKNLSGSGRLEKYEDWRLSAEERAEDLASRLSMEQIAGLMLYSSHQTVTSPGKGDTFNQRFAGTYDGKPFDMEHGDITQLTDQQKEFLEIDQVRHILLTTVESAEAAAKWNNHIQEFCEGTGLGIPASISSDPRHGAASNGEFFVGARGMISQWPSQLGLAATFCPETVKRFGEILADEYRGLGIVTALSPQIDLASEPRWNRYNGTFGEGTKLTVDLARAYVDGCQTTEESPDGWGSRSVNAMVKHWPGGGTGEGGRDAHFSYGKYAVYPGENFEEHLKPFTEGAFRLDGKTGQASSVMPYYTISYGIDKKYGENVGNSYSKYIVQELLRDTCGYDGVVCTDWGITDTCSSDEMISGMNWGTAHLSVEERHYKALMAGVDQFGGNTKKAPVLAAYRMGCASAGEEAMRERMRRSAKRILKNIFRPGLFENPYVDTEESRHVVGNAAFMEAGFQAQKDSVVLLKNKGQILPLKPGTKVYIPECPETWLYGMPALFAEDLRVPGHPWLERALAGQYFTPVDSPEEADAAIVFMESPKPMLPGYSREKGYVPLTLQYRPYTSQKGRKKSIAGGDPFCYAHQEEEFRSRGNTSGVSSGYQASDRAYLGKTNTCANEKQLDVFLQTKEAMGEKPVIAVVDTSGPMVVSEFEPLADAVLMGFEIQKQAYLEVIIGRHTPSGLLPFQIPADMDTVEEQQEDVPRDVRCYEDTCGHKYDFAYGMDFSQVIEDERVRRYR